MLEQRQRAVAMGMAQTREGTGGADKGYVR
jgi:hypothetical protein